jgi:7-keto-8-aminopelargonate synthetase-like enzyme
MNDFDSELSQRLALLREQGLYRQLRKIDSAQSPRIQIGDKEVLNFSSNDYLGLANDPVLKQAAMRAIEAYGAGGGASRLICGSLGPHHELEQAIAGFKSTQAALSFSTGYAAALGTICALLGKDDIIILDKLVHASIVDAARLCGAKLRVFAHNDLNELEDILRWADGRQRVDSGTSEMRDDSIQALEGSLDGPRLPAIGRRARILVVTESVFSMDGDQAPLAEIVGLKNRYGAWLMVDEAHATGVYGPNRRGLSEELGVGDKIEIQMGTLGKALGASGGYICGSRALIDYLVNCARSFIFSTAPVPAAAAAATAAVNFVQSTAGEERRHSLWQRLAELRSLFDERAKSQSTRTSSNKSSDNERRPHNSRLGPIVPLPIGDETKAVETAAALGERGILIPAIRYPTVARGSARLRLTLSAAHTQAEIERLVSTLGALNLGYRIPDSGF